MRETRCVPPLAGVEGEGLEKMLWRGFGGEALAGVMCGWRTRCCV